MTATLTCKKGRPFMSTRTLSSFMRETIKSLHDSGKSRTSETYQATLNSFMLFRNGKDIPLRKVDAVLMMQYELHLKERGVSLNTISFYMRILRAVYNRAVEQELIRQASPFKRVYTGVEKTVKRAVSLSTLKRLKKLNLTADASKELARDLFLFSFYTRGMSFVDMAYLRKSDLSQGFLTYRRKKTGQQLTIRWESCMQAIVDKHSVPSSDYLLPIITHCTVEERIQYKNSLSRVNRHLKELGRTLHLAHPLTMYVARHSWASAAKQKNIPLSVISEGMGHDSEKTTLIYLSALEASVIDKANRNILKELQ